MGKQSQGVGRGCWGHLKACLLRRMLAPLVREDSSDLCQYKRVQNDCGCFANKRGNTEGLK